MVNQLDVSIQILEGSQALVKLASALMEINSGKTEKTELDTWLEDIYADKVLNNAEFLQLRDKADQVFEHLAGTLASVSETSEFQLAVDDSVQHMQKILLAIKKTKPDDKLKADVKLAFGFQLAYLKANFDRFYQAL